MNNAHDWITSHGKILHQEAQAGHGPESKGFTTHLWPSSLNYYSPIYSVFLADLQSLKTLNLRTLWTVRDGMVPLTWFFYQHPRPTGIKTKLLIYEDFLPFIPVAWKNHVGTYQFINNPTTTPPLSLSKTIRLIFTHSPKEALDGNTTLKNLTSLSKWIKQEKIKISNSLFLSGPIHGGIGDSELQASLKTVQIISTLFEGKLEIIQWEKIQLLDSCADMLIVDLSNKMLCADSFVHQLLLSRSARFPQFKGINKGKRATTPRNYLPISLFHGISYNASPYAYPVMNPSLFGGKMPKKFVSPVGCQGREPLEKPEVSVASIKGYWERLAEVVRFNKLSSQVIADSSPGSHWPSWLPEWCFLETRNFGY